MARSDAHIVEANLLMHIGLYNSFFSNLYMCNFVYFYHTEVMGEFYPTFLLVLVGIILA